MRSVLLAGPTSSDPAGRRAVLQAVQSVLPARKVLEVTSPTPTRSVLDRARSSDGIVFAGVPLHRLYPRAEGRRAVGTSPLRSLATAAAVAAAARRPLAAIGVTTGPVLGRPARQTVSRVVRRPDLLLIGDEESAGHLAAAGVPGPLRVAADPAWAALLPSIRPATPGDAVVVVVDGRVGRKVEADLGAGLAAAARAGHRIRVLPWAGPGCGDGAMSWRLTRQLRSASPVPVEVETVPHDLGEAADRFAGARVVVALRYRAIHAAAATGVPVIGVAVEARIPALAGRLGQPVLGPDRLASGLPVLIDQASPGTGPRPADVRAEVGRARTGLNLLRLMLDPSAVGAEELNCLPLVPVPWLS